MARPNSTSIDGEIRQQRTVPERSSLVRMMLPNIITALAVFAGLNSIRLSFDERYDLALASIIVAALLDGVDGRLARVLGATSRFGAEFDSLADFLNFGVAPVVLLSIWSGDELGKFTWLVLMIYALSAGLRLARFNTHLGDIKASWQRSYFIGMPTPIAAVAVLLPVYMVSPGGAVEIPLRVADCYTLLIAFLMVSNIPSLSGKGFGAGCSRRVILIGVPLVLFGLGASLVLYPKATLTAVTLAYLTSLPFSWRSYRARSSALAGGVVDGGT